MANEPETRIVGRPGEWRTGSLYWAFRLTVIPIAVAAIVVAGLTNAALGLEFIAVVVAAAAVLWMRSMQVHIGATADFLVIADLWRTTRVRWSDITSVASEDGLLVVRTTNGAISRPSVGRNVTPAHLDDIVERINASLAEHR